MKYETIEQAASALGVSVRQGWRYLKAGRIVKTQNGFAVTGTTDTDIMPDMAESGTVPYKKPFSVSATPIKNNSIDSLKAELAASRISLEIEKAEAARASWQKRQDAERRAESESKAMLQAQKLRLAAESREKNKARKLITAKIQRLKAELLPVAVRDIVPTGIQAQIYLEISKLAGEAELLSYEDLLCIATANRDKILAKNYDVVTEAFRSYGRNLLLAKLQEISNDK